MATIGRSARALQLVLAILLACVVVTAQTEAASRTKVVLLGTGTPLPDPDRAGPATAIVVDGTPYLVDCGTGIVRRAAAARNAGVKALEPVNLKIVFLTHLHSDHTLGLPDLIITPWIMGRKEPLELYGPPGSKQMVEHILEAYAVDIKTRTEGLEHSNHTGYKVNVHEITPGIVYRDDKVTVTAFNAAHGELAHSYGYRFQTPGRVIVHCGDSSPKSDIIANCRGCDVLIHEAYTLASYDKVPPDWQLYRRTYHTSTRELAEIAGKTKPGLLILFHRGNAGCDQARTEDCRLAGSEEQMLKEIRESYKGKVVAGHDLDIY